MPICSCQFPQFPSRRPQLWIRIRTLIFERFYKFVKQDCEEGAANGSDPVDPLRGVEGVDRDGGAEGAGRVERAAGPEDAWRIAVRGACC